MVPLDRLKDPAQTRISEAKCLQRPYGLMMMLCSESVLRLRRVTHPSRPAPDPMVWPRRDTSSSHVVSTFETRLSQRRFNRPAIAQRISIQRDDHNLFGFASFFLSKTTFGRPHKNTHQQYCHDYGYFDYFYA